MVVKLSYEMFYKFNTVYVFISFPIHVCSTERPPRGRVTTSYKLQGYSYGTSETENSTKYQQNIHMVAEPVAPIGKRFSGDVATYPKFKYRVKADINL